MKWKGFKSEIPLLENLRITRYVSHPSPKTHRNPWILGRQSNGLWRVCIYIRLVDRYDKAFVHLLCAKTRVVSLKPLTTPKLELCAAVILVKLIKKVTDSLVIPIQCIHYWCDSTITLAWIATELRLLKTFISNHVTEIQSLSNSSDWRYVNTKENLADLLSRGLMPKLIVTSSL